MGIAHAMYHTSSNVHTNSLGQTVIGGTDLGNGCIVGGQVVNAPPPSAVEVAVVNAISTAWQTRNDPPKPGQTSSGRI